MESSISIVAQLVKAKAIRVLMAPPFSGCNCPAPERRRRPRLDQSDLDRPFYYREEGCPLFCLSDNSRVQVLLQFPLQGKALGSVVCVSVPCSSDRILAVQAEIEGFTSFLPVERRLCIRVLSYILDQVASHYRNMSPIEELNRVREQVGALLQAAMEARDAEREAMRLEVHDGVVQTLTGAFQYLQTAEALIQKGHPAQSLLLRASGLVKQAVQESREMANNLEPRTFFETLKELGLVGTLKEELVQLERETGCKGEITSGVESLPWDVEGALYKIAHEALINVRRHSEASRVRVEIAREGDGVLVKIQDWGKGFDPSILATTQRRMSGLTTMRRRAEALGGGCQVESSPGKGTLVTVWAPLNP